MMLTQLSLLATSAQETQTAQLLKQLRDIHQPEPVSWWPLAPGWWIIIGLVVLIAALFIIKAILKKRHYRYVRLAVKELKQLKQANEETRWLARSHNVMRRLSLCYVPEDKIGSMNQQEWQAFLQATSKQSLNNQTLSEQTINAFADLPYKPANYSETLDKDAILNEVTQWAEGLPEHAKQWLNQHQTRSNTKDTVKSTVKESSDV
ncbi:DUF4381 domain-containing protein [Kangiella spongicola]|uniref:DUF4381 domain-containing protein n=1 Tax=Kangiella spongicola TaxID=796379 RepID=A0A318D764_9GAMM|nr:DUF4381 domain-containing protein [Kangiella spongicola]PXF63765.1 DUF4381 domain-containing protein [Kangiella spongicola]